MRTIPHLRELTQTMRALEFTGKYHEAFECASHFWKNVNAPPDTKGLKLREKGELLLRCGRLAGLLGRMENSLATQDNSKNLLSSAREIFLEIGDQEGIVDSENGLGLAYLRRGEHREAEVWINSSLDRDLPSTNFTRIESFICKSVILLELKRFDDALNFLKSVEPFFEEFDDDYLNGCFATNLGVAYRNLANLPASMQMYSLARHFHKKSGHLGYLATVENNLSLLYKDDGRFDQSHKCIDRAIRLYKKVGDWSRLGYSYDSKACLLLAERRFEEALDAIETGLEILRKTEFADYLIESLFTKMQILAARGQIGLAAISFGEAAHYASEIQGDDRVALLAEEFEKLVLQSGFSGLGRIFTQRIISGENLELLLPSSLSVYRDFEAVWIKNDDLKNAGLVKGSLALMVAEDTGRGDIVALVEEGCDEVVCGYYDQDFGIVALSTDRSLEPQVFAEESVEVLGKIVGYADPEKRRNGKLEVRLLQAK